MLANRTFGTWLKQRRTALGLTQIELARVVACSPSLIRKYESEVRRPSHQVATHLAQALGLSTQQQQQFIHLALFGATGEPGVPVPTAPTLATHDSLLVMPGPLIGRANDLLTLRTRLAHAQLLTLIGPPGVGKTRLAIEVARAYAGNTDAQVILIELATLRTHHLVMATIAHAFGIHALDEGDALTALVLALRAKPTLLVLDNFEHVLAAAPQLATLLARCATLRVLVTSRVALRLRAERRYTVAPLALPEKHAPAQAIDSSPAVALFAERAEAVAPAFQLTPQNRATVVAICTRLDGLPLAIELAAARVDEIDLALLLTQLEQRLAVLVEGPRDLPARQQTLRDAIRWSFDNLPAAEQRAFALLGTFVGGFDADAARAIGVNRILALAQKSLVQVTGAASPRYLLLETLREFALEHLSPSQLVQAQHRHASYFAERAEQPTIEQLGEVAWMHQVDLDLENYRAAMRWSLAHDSGAVGARILVALATYLYSRGLFVIEDAWLALLALPLAESGLPPQLQSRAAYVVGYLRSQYGDTSGQSLALLKHSEALAHVANDDITAARALTARGMLMRYPGNSVNTISILEQARELAEQIEDLQLLGQIYSQIGMCCLEWSRYTDAQVAFERAISHEQAASRQFRIIRVLPDLAEAVLRQGDRTRARELFQQAQQRANDFGDREVAAEAEIGLGVIALLEGDVVSAGERIERALAALREIGIILIPRTSYLASVIAFRTQRFGQARELFTNTLTSAYDSFSIEVIAYGLLGLAALDAREGAVALAAARIGAANAICERFSCREDYFEQALRATVETAPSVQANRTEFQAVALQSEARLRAALPVVTFASCFEAFEQLQLRQQVERVLRGAQVRAVAAD